MKYIKDFFYNLSDLVLILLILAAAGGLIYWRVNVIMDYPEALAAEIRDGGTQGLVPDNLIGDQNQDANQNSSAQDGENSNTNENVNENNNGENSTGNSGESSGESSNESGDENSGTTEPGAPIDTSTEPEPGSGPRDNTIWKDGKLRLDMTVQLASGSSEEAVESLVQAGLFSSYEDFEAVCDAIGTDPGMVLAGSYTFPAGSTQNDIAALVTID